MKNYSRFEIKKINELENDFRMYGYECIGMLVKEYGEFYEELVELEWNMCLCDFISTYWDNNSSVFTI